MTVVGQRPNTTAEALAELLAGNQRFVSGAPVHPRQDAVRRAALARGQHPFAVVFGCSDSRLAAEIIFDCGLGDLFVVRTAGHVIGPEVLASIEYGTAVLDVPLIVVLGHQSCGAIAAACATADGENLPQRSLDAVVNQVVPSVEYAHQWQITDPDEICALHVRRTVEMIVRDGAATSAAVADGRCAVVGMTYRLAEGRVTVVTD